MSEQAPASVKPTLKLKKILIGPNGLYEALPAKGAEAGAADMGA